MNNSANGGNKGGKVMKIVLNKCFGGFGLSHEAKMEIFKRKNIEVFPYINNFSYDSDDEYTRHTGQKLGSMDFIYYFKKDPKIDKVTGIYSEIDRLYGIADIPVFQPIKEVFAYDFHSYNYIDNYCTDYCANMVNLSIKKEVETTS